MNREDNRKRIRKALKTLNGMDNNVQFIFEEDKDSVSIRCISRESEHLLYGAYSSMECFSDYAYPTLAYDTLRKFAEMMVAATRLNSPTAYHNLVA